MKRVFYYQVDRKKGIVFLAIYCSIIFGALIAFAGLDRMADTVNWLVENGIEVLLIAVVVLFVVPAIFISRKVYGKHELVIDGEEAQIKKGGAIVETIKLPDVHSLEFIRQFNSVKLFGATGSLLYKFKAMDITGDDITKINNSFVETLPLECASRKKNFLGTEYETIDCRRKL